MGTVWAASECDWPRQHIVLAKAILGTAIRDRARDAACRNFQVPASTGAGNVASNDVRRRGIPELFAET